MSKVISLLFDDYSEASQFLEELSPEIKNLEFQDKNNLLSEIKSRKPGLILLNATDETCFVKAKELIKIVRTDKVLKKTSIAVLTQENVHPSEEEGLIETGANIIIPTPSDPKLWTFKLEKLIDIPERHKIRAPVQIVTWTKVKGVENFVQGLALNINLGGMLLQLPIKLAPDTKIDIFFSLPGDMQPLSCVGRIVWQEKTSKRCGVEFLAQRGDSRERLAQFLDDVFSKPGGLIKKDTPINKIVTEEIRWETLLRANDARKDAILNASFDCIVAVDQEDKIVEFNEVSEKTFGYQKIDILLHRKLDRLLPENICLELRKFLFDFVENKEGLQKNELWETQAKRSDGSLFPVEIIVKAIYAEREALLIINIKDVTSRKKMMEEYKRAAQLAALGTVAAGLAHEINNPIQGIMNYATLLEKSPEKTERVIDLSQRIFKEGARIANITQDLLHYSKNNVIEKVLSDINSLTQSALSLIDLKIKSQGVQIDVDLSVDLPMIPVQPQSFQQVIVNLLDNANDALQAKEMTIEDKVLSISTSLRETEKDRYVCIEVYDNGIGMSESVQARAKEAFFSTKPSVQGTGLGLSIVNDILHKHNGKLIIESVEGEYCKMKALFLVA